VTVYTKLSDHLTRTDYFDVGTFTTGKAKFAVYHFREVGQKLPMHLHKTEELNHITICCSGQVRVHGLNFEEFVMSPGDIVDWVELKEPHEFVAKVADSRIVNVMKG
jgi:hypothetical protein